MSAGGLSYSMLTTNRKATLPSVEMWGTNMNILQDPNTGIFTRRIDKVGDTQSILLSQDGSGDRIAEMINVYARGVNPMVSVSYNNNSNNAGIQSNLKNIQAAKLPYKPEVFYPPSYRAEDLMPLSRQPRNWFYALTNPVVPNILSQMSCPETKYTIHKNKQNIDTVTNLQYDLQSTDRQNNIDIFNLLNKIQKNPQRKFETNQLSDNINNFQQFDSLDPKNFQTIRQYDKQSGISNQNVGDSKEFIQHQDKKSIQENKLLYNVFANKSGNKNITNNREFIQSIQKKALNDSLNHYQLISNPNQYEKNIEHNNLSKGINKNYESIDTISNTSGLYKKQNTEVLKPSQGIYEDPLLISTLSNPNKNIHKTIDPMNEPKTKNLLHTQGSTNISNTYQKNDNIGGFVSPKIKDPLHTEGSTNISDIYQKNDNIGGFVSPKTKDILHTEGSTNISDIYQKNDDIGGFVSPKIKDPLHTEGSTNISDIYQKNDNIEGFVSTKTRDILHTEGSTNISDIYQKNDNIEGFVSPKTRDILHTEGTTNISDIYQKNDNIEGFVSPKTRDILHTDGTTNISDIYQKNDNIEGFVSPKIKDHLHTEGSTNISNIYQKNEMYMNNIPKESTNARLNTEYQTTPSMTKFWKTVDPIIDSKTNIKDYINIKFDGNKTNTKFQSMIQQDQLNREPKRHNPYVFSQTNKTSSVTKNVEIDQLGTGKTIQLTNIEYESRPSANIHKSVVDINADIPIRIKDSFNVPVTSVIGNSDYKKGLEGYQESKQKTGIDELFQHKSANTNLRLFEKTGDLGYKENNERKSILIQNQETVYDKKSFGKEFYSSVQSTNAKQYTNPNFTTNGSFEALGNYVPKFERTFENGSDMPINTQFMDIKKRAVNQFSDRFQSNYFKS
jgi:hypothetical protein